MINPSDAIHKEKIEKIVEHIVNVLQPRYSASKSNSNENISYEELKRLLQLFNATELDIHSKVTMDAVLSQLNYIIDKLPASSGLLLSALKKLEKKAFLLLHAIFDLNDKAVRELLENGQSVDLGEFNSYVVNFLYETIILSTWLDNPDSNAIDNEVLQSSLFDQNNEKIKAVKILELLLCFGFQPIYRNQYLSDRTYTFEYEDETYAKQDLIEALGKKSFLLDAIKPVQELEPTKFIPIVFSAAFQRIWNNTSVFSDFAATFTCEMEEIHDTVTLEQQTIENNPKKAGLEPFLKASELTRWLPIPVSALVFKYAADARSLVFDRFQKENRYTRMFDKIIPVG